MTTINSQVEKISRVLLSGRFEVPWHQRHYVWGDLEVRDLLYDLKEAFDKDRTCYFLGSVMLLEATGEMPKRINDGQQRLITFSLLVAALCRHFKKHDKARESLALRMLFDRGDLDTSLLTDATHYEPRISPPKEDKMNYVQLIRGRDIGTNGGLINAWNRIKEEFVRRMDEKTQANFFDFLKEKVEISVLEIPSDVDANFVFETLNARGKSLGHVDLIRNWVLSCFSEKDEKPRLETVHGNFERAGVILGRGNKVEAYFHCFLQCSYGFLRKKRFYREFREEFQKSADDSVSSSEYAYDLVTELGHPGSIELYRFMTSGKSNSDLALPKIHGKRNLDVLLNEIRGYRVSHPLCFALLHRFMVEAKSTEQNDVEKVVVRSLKNLASFIMRGTFVTSQFRPSKIEEDLSNCAKTVFTGTDIDSLDIMAELEKNDEFKIIDDSHFIRRMTEGEVSKADNKKIRRYLYGINAHDQKGSDVLKFDECSVEHVLPQSEVHWPGWEKFKDQDPAAWIHRMGNLVIISKKENQSGADFNANFAAKCRAFSESPLKMARDVAKDYKEWSPQVIENRSKKLAEKAAEIWKFHRAK